MFFTGLCILWITAISNCYSLLKSENLSTCTPSFSEVCGNASDWWYNAIPPLLIHTGNRLDPASSQL